MTDSMKRAINETNRRREIQVAYNLENGITPQSIIKAIDTNLIAIAEADYITVPLEPESPIEQLSPEARAKFIGELEEQMRECAKKFDFEKAAQIRDRVKGLKSNGLYEDTAAGSTGLRRSN